MKITLESTPTLTEINGQECRVWRGTTERGIAITAFIPAIAVDAMADQAQFSAELIETGAPRELATREAQELAVAMGTL